MFFYDVVFMNWKSKQSAGELLLSFVTAKKFYNAMTVWRNHQQKHSLIVESVVL